MSPREHYSGYDDETTARCERALLTLLGDLGPWRDRIFLAGGLAPRYLIKEMHEAPAHVGTTDVDLVIGLALGDESPETYFTLQNNLEKAHFTQEEPSFRWSRSVDGITVHVEFLCETGQVAFGRVFKPKAGTGARLAAFNVRGAHLVREDFIEREIAGERLDSGGHSRVVVRIAGLLPYVVLKIFAFQDRHQNKDAYDLVFTLLHYADDTREAGAVAAMSAVAGADDVRAALALLGERFRDAAQDGPHAYANFLAPDHPEENARLRQEAVAVVREFLAGFASDNG